MDPDDFVTLEKGSLSDCNRVLKQFNCQNASTFSFAGFDAVAKQRLGEILAQRLVDPQFTEFYSSALEFIRILARDKSHLEELSNEQLLHVLAIRSRLTKELQGTFPADHEIPVTTEAQKVLCNVVFHSKAAQRYFSREEITDVLMSRITANKELSKWPLENQLLDMKLLFIITILCADTRSHFRNDLHAIQDLCVMATTLGTSTRRRSSGTSASGAGDQATATTVVCEILKVLFNLVCSISQANLTLGEEMDFVNLGIMSRELLILQQSDELKKHVINLLTMVKKCGYNQLAFPITEGTTPVAPFCESDLHAVDVILKYLDSKLSSTGRKSVDDSLAPVLCALTEASKAVPVIRKYLKSQVLPPLRNVHTRPEVGSSLRNKICRLLTSSVSSVRDSAGDFLFILCKNNSQRLIKYTGYGNAAGWLAEHGLMGLRRSKEEELEDTEPSDTEEYKEFKEKIDLMTGAIRVEGPEPMAGMTEEQKERAAIDLVNALHKLLDTGDFKPAAIGPDGKPQVISNVHEFREQILKERNAPDEAAKSSDEEE